MPSTTAGYKLPYPLGTDRVMDGDDQIRKLAQSVENCMQSGTVSVNVTTGGTPATATVTFPVAYTVAPIVICSATGGNPLTVGAMPSAISNTGFTMNAVRNTAGAQTCNWVAIGPIAAVA